MAENIDRATPAQVAELVRLLVQEVRASGKSIDLGSLVWTPPARPFFEQGEPASMWSPRADANREYQRGVLDYYLEVG